MMREFGKPADETGVRPLAHGPAIKLDDEIRETPDEGMRPFLADTGEDEADHTAAKLIGGVVAGALILGGGLYAYETTMTNTLPPQQIAANYQFKDLYDLWLAPGKDVVFVKSTRIEVNTTPARNPLLAH